MLTIFELSSGQKHSTVFFVFKDSRNLQSDI